jgi:putative salt-induced outer membrane protein YdiY
MITPPRSRVLAAFAVSAFLSAAARADDAAAPVKRWKDSAEASFVNANGNSQTTTTSAKDTFGFTFDQWTSLELEGGGLGARSQGQVTAEQYYAAEKTQRKWDDRNYGFEKYRWDKNRFAGIANRQEVSLGVGRELWKNATSLLTGELAPGYLNEERIGDKRRSFASSRVYSRFTHDFTATSKFLQDVEYLQSLADKRDSRINTTTELTTALSAHFSVKTSFIWKRSNQPPAGVRKDDEITSFSLLATF